uniref:Uncharacterized protein n=1 Tax=Vannella robusta TaxID=1487602 RepID=A0A7S4HN69_9EUKA|mmetsp:Transcript_13189/g.16550  ORF Transcript_13189/g.16550 Transcript_13189/m.16550 type:complete len:223 (+) Transcript_13189:162-830(+)
MELPLGMFPFTFEYLQRLDANERAKYLQSLEALWSHFLENHPEKHDVKEETEDQWKQRLHKQFLNTILEFYNHRFRLPSSTVSPVFPTSDEEQDKTRSTNSRNSSLGSLLEALSDKEFEIPPETSYITTRRTRQRLIPTTPDTYTISPPLKRRKLAYTDEKRLSRYRSTPSKVFSFFVVFVSLHFLMIFVFVVGVDGKTKKYISRKISANRGGCDGRWQKSF